MILEADGITLRYPQRPRPALDAVSCHVTANELVAVVGPNGSGKTTLVRVISGLLRAEAGAVSVDGRPLARWKRAELAGILAVVPQGEAVTFPLRVEDRKSVV